jgi:autotransporter-associated beta strand protein
MNVEHAFHPSRGLRAVLVLAAFAATRIGIYGGVIKEGIGDLRLAANNTYAGMTTVDEGYLYVMHGHAVGVADGTAANGTVVNGAKVALSCCWGSEDLTPDVTHSQGSSFSRFSVARPRGSTRCATRSPQPTTSMNEPRATTRPQSVADHVNTCSC